MLVQQTDMSNNSIINNNLIIPMIIRRLRDL